MTDQSFLQITILGCGSSAGVPRVGPAGWGACDPKNPKNRRRRCSILVERIAATGRTIVLIDTSPDLREQLLAANVEHLDAVLYTHMHADHTHGIDDLRPFVIVMQQRVRIYADRPTSERLLKQFDYCFVTPPGSSYPPILKHNPMEAGRNVVIDGPGGAITFEPFKVVHGEVLSLGFRIGGIAYLPDVSEVPEAAKAVLHDLDVLIIDALRYKTHPSHFGVADALALIGEVKPRRAILTNMHNELDYEILRGQLPDGVEPAFDGLVVTGR